MRTALVPLIGLVLAAPAVAAQATEHVVYLHENPLHILPEEIHASVGDTLRFIIENPHAPGKTPHNFLVCGDGESPLEKCDDRWAFTGMIQPGENATITFQVPRAGTFDYYCYIAGHKAGGMTGKLIVAGDEKSGIPLGPVGLAGLALGALLLARRRSA